MSSYIKTRDYEQVLLDIERALEWINSLDVQTANTRLEKYRRDMAELLTRWKKNNYEDFKLNDPTHHFNMVVELDDLTEIHLGLNSFETDDIKKKLKQLATGQELLTKESGKKSSRETAFELYIASKIAQADNFVSFDTVADVKSRINNKSIFIECKKIRSKKNTRSTIKQALSQLQKRYTEEDTNAYGYAAISIDTEVNPRLGFLEYSSRQNPLEMVEEYCINFIDKNKKYWWEPRDERTLGCIISLRVPIVDKTTRLISVCRSLVVNNSWPTTHFQNTVHEVVAKCLFKR